MRVLCAPDSFKGSLDAKRVAQAISKGILESATEWIVDIHPLADGGEGTLEVLSDHGFTLEARTVRNQLGREISAKFGLREDTALIESAQACAFDPNATAADALVASTNGVGELILHALDAGATEILLAIGGTATTDGGAGMLTALGCELLDAQGQSIGPGGVGLLQLQSVDWSALDPRVRKTQFRVLSDVTNPLLGPTGSARVFAPQKGADQDAVELLEGGLSRLASVIGSEFAQLSGAGSGGGLGFAALAALGAQLESGARAIMQLTRFYEKLAEVDLVIAGEGSFDAQSLAGKIAQEVIKAAGLQAVPALLVCGKSSPLTDAEMKNLGLIGILRLTDLEPNVQLSISNAERLLEEVARQIPDLVSRLSFNGSR